MNINYNANSAVPVKTLIHKLTKYQTLNAKAQAQGSPKARVYEAKVNEYVDKLRAIGVKAPLTGGANLEDFNQGMQQYGQKIDQQIEGLKKKLDDGKIDGIEDIQKKVRSLQEASEKTFQKYKESRKEIVGIIEASLVQINRLSERLNELTSRNFGISEGDKEKLNDINRNIEQVQEHTENQLQELDSDPQINTLFQQLQSYITPQT